MRPSTFFTYATGLDYPVGLNAWNGQPLKLLPLLSYLVPDAPIAAEEVNYALNAAGAGSNAVLNLAGQIPSTNWNIAQDAYTTFTCTQPTITPVSTAYYVDNFSIDHLTYDFYQGRWLAVAGTTSGTAGTVFESYDGLNWTALSSTISGFNLSQTIIVAGAASGYSMVVEAASNKYATVINDTVVEYTHNFNWSSGSAGACYFAPSGGPWIVQWSSAKANFGIGGGSPSWSASSSTMIAGLGNIFCTDGTQLLCIFPITVNPTQYMTTTDGENWTAVSLPTILSGEQIVSASYDASNKVYVFVTSTSSQGRVFISTAGTSGTWSLAGTIAHQTLSLACNGAEWSCAVIILGHTRYLSSVDTGTSWQFSFNMYGGMPQPVASVPYNVGIRCNGSQFYTVFVTPTATSGGGNGGYAISMSTGKMPTLSF